MTCSSSSVLAAGAVTVGSVSTLLGPSRTRDAVEQYDRLLARWDLNEGDRAEALAGRGMVLIYGLCAEDAIADAQLALALAERSGRRREAALGPASLTYAERRVARRVADGLTNRQIAERLDVSRRTVDTHVAASLAKLTLTSRVQLAALVATGVVH